MNKIEINNVSKTYSNTKALEDVSIVFKPNKIYGLLGRNGAGKSTLINIIADRIFADKGSIFINGNQVGDNSKIQNHLFCMSESDYYDMSMTIKNQFKMIEALNENFDKEFAKSLAERFELDVNSKLRSLSKGYLTIFKLIIALSMNVDYVFYDEPIQGLDANHRELFYKLLVQNYEKRDHTVVIATHLIEEVANLIEEVIIIHEGKVLLSQPVEDLLSDGYSVSGRIDDVDEYIANKNILDVEVLGGLKVAHILDDRKFDVPSTLDVVPISLQKMFIYLTEKGSVNYE